ncbi:MAG: hypothetical protein KC457_13310 [Myxococcales bacterium]|nr:hypothetical protein [Myxococcales bacterium]
MVEVPDGSSFVIQSGQRFRYFELVPIEPGECWDKESALQNSELVLGQRVRLQYPEGCWGQDPMPAYVSVAGKNVAMSLVEIGAACVDLGEEGASMKDVSISAYHEAQILAKLLGKGLWGTCTDDPCEPDLSSRPPWSPAY